MGEGNYALEPVPGVRTAEGTAATAETTQLAAITVSARTQNNLTAPARQVTLLDGEEIQQLRQGSDSLATMLSKAVPGMADSSHTITDYGQTLRGRNMLVLVDGVPLNTNRDSSRNLANINPADIEQIEVLRGSSAIYGSGAAGGIVSIRTKRPAGETKAETIVGGVTPLSRLGGAGLGGEVQHYLSGGGDVVDYSVSLGARHVGASFDGKGHRIAPEPSQGDMFDSNIYNATAKVGFKLAEDQRLQLSASRYDARQDTKYASDPSVAKLPPDPCRQDRSRGSSSTTRTRSRTPSWGWTTKTRTWPAARSPPSSTTGISSRASRPSTRAPFPFAAATSTRPCKTRRSSADA